MGIEVVKTASEEAKMGIEVVKTASEEAKMGIEVVKTASEEAKMGIEVVKIGSEEAKMGIEVVKTGSEEVKMGIEVVKTGSEEAKMGIEVAMVELEMMEAGHSLAGSPLAKHHCIAFSTTRIFSSCVTKTRCSEVVPDVLSTNLWNSTPSRSSNASTCCRRALLSSLENPEGYAGFPALALRMY